MRATTSTPRCSGRRPRPARLRPRYHEGLARPDLLTPGEVYEIEIDMAATANVFRAGHRIRVDVSSGNFPRFDRNTNTDGRICEESIDDAVVARNTVWTGPRRPSRVCLPLRQPGGTGSTRTP